MSLFSLMLAAALSTSPPPPPASARITFSGRHIGRGIAAGVADNATGRRVHPSDPVRIASISKLATAIAVMRLVDQHRIDLDRDVSAYLGWTLRHPAFPDVPITLRQILSHTAGVRDGAGYALAVDDELPVHLTNPAAWDAAHPPGDYFAYTNLNFAVVAAAMEGATGERFDRLMAKLLFAPLGIDACFNWTTCSDRAVRRAVVLYRSTGEVARDDLHGIRPACPGTPAGDGEGDGDGDCAIPQYVLAHNGSFFAPQGGMRIAVTDLAKLGRVLSGAVGGFLSPASRATMIRPQWRFNGSNGDTEHGLFCSYGLGVMILALPNRPAACRDDPFGDGRTRIGHAGEAYGLRSGLWIDPATQRGVAFFTTEVADDAPTGPRSAFNSVEEVMLANAKPE